MDILIKILQFFLCFTILVGIHELGHFIMARVFRIRVEKFYIFFDPWFSLFRHLVLFPVFRHLAFAVAVEQFYKEDVVVAYKSHLVAVR